MDEAQAIAAEAAAGAALSPRAGRSDPLDILIGGRVRRLRVARGLSQTELGAAINVTFQQIQKYEAGTNRIAASTLVRIADALDVAPDELLSGGAALTIEPDARPSLLATPGAEALLTGYAKLGSETLRRAVLSLVREMSGERPADPPVISEIGPNGAMRA
jgi:transcriptional regulator with XRE-family HTH domain